MNVFARPASFMALALAPLSLVAALTPVAKDTPIAVIPEPASTQAVAGASYALPDTFTVAFSPRLSGVVAANGPALSKLTGVEKLAAKAGGDADMTFVEDKSVKPEGYRLDIGDKGIRLLASDEAGFLNGVRTLAQLVREQDGKKFLPKVRIDDAPRFPFRSLMIDPARHHWKVEDVLRFLDTMAAYKYNRLHFHLSDDQGWRLAIPKWPRLAEVASKRAETDGDGKPHEGLYTKADLKRIVEHAARHRIEVIPEIDVPGHNAALLAAYPEFACFPKDDFKVRTTAGVSKELLCPANEKVYALFADIYEELADIFPAKHWHMGGDEAPLDRWNECPHCAAQRKKEKLKDSREQMGYFFRRMAALMKKHGKTPLFWYEDDVTGYPKDAVMYTWRMGKTPKVIELARQNGWQLIAAPGEHAYLDYPQVPGGLPVSESKSASWMPVTTLKRTYAFDPGYGLPAEKSKHIIGVEGTLWGEEIRDRDRADHMVWPRGWALAEAGWSPMSVRSWEKFHAKLPYHAERAREAGITIGPLPAKP